MLIAIIAIVDAVSTGETYFRTLRQGASVAWVALFPSYEQQQYLRKSR